MAAGTGYANIIGQLGSLGLTLASQKRTGAEKMNRRIGRGGQDPALAALRSQLASQNTRSAMAVAASQQGVNPALAQRNAQQALADVQGRTNAQFARLGAMSAMQARQASTDAERKRRMLLFGGASKGLNEFSQGLAAMNAGGPPTERGSGDPGADGAAGAAGLSAPQAQQPAAAPFQGLAPSSGFGQSVSGLMAPSAPAATGAAGLSAPAPAAAPAPATPSFASMNAGQPGQMQMRGSLDNIGLGQNPAVGQLRQRDPELNRLRQGMAAGEFEPGPAEQPVNMMGQTPEPVGSPQIPSDAQQLIQYYIQQGMSPEAAAYLAGAGGGQSMSAVLGRSTLGL